MVGMLTMNKCRFFCCLLLLGFLNPTYYANAQQNYSGNSALNCDAQDSTGPHPDFLYTCNGQFHYCQAFLIFKSRPQFDSVSSISNLTSSDQQDLSTINNVTRRSVFPTNKEVIVPVNCSCLGRYFQANTTFQLTSEYGTYFLVARDVFEGLSTCASLMRENPYGKSDLVEGMKLLVPLRCACPNRQQIMNGTKYLMTYLVNWNDTILGLAQRFNVTAVSLNEANNLDNNSILYPDTTILIPLPSPPLSSQTIIHNSPMKSSPPGLLPLQPVNPGNTRSKQKLYEICGVAAGCSLLVLGITLAVVFQLCKKRNKRVLETQVENKEDLSKDLRVGIASFKQVLKVFKIEEIKKATENFSPNHRIKGSVYLGNFGVEVLAVKRVDGDVSKEVNILQRITHINLIKLHGVCKFRGLFFLVFEYMSSGSLREWLSNESSKDKESWGRRVQIALDIASGLHYLHSFTEPAFVHKGIESSHVLLTSDLRAKISNFRQASITTKGAPYGTLSNHLIGTRGYMAPEYLEAGEVTPKMDVYAFGIVLLELLTGKDAVFRVEGKEALLSAAIVSILEKDNAEAALVPWVDPNLPKGNPSMEIALRLAKVSAACLTKDLAMRPSMEKVVSILLKIQDVHVSEVTLVHTLDVTDPLIVTCWMK